MFDDGQAEAGATHGARSGFIGAIETLEYPGEIFGGNADAGIANQDAHLTVVAAHLHLNFAVGAIELDGVIQQIRTLSYLLHPLLLEEAGLASALRWYASGFAERSGIKVKVVMKGGFGRLPKETEISVLRIVQEGLTNVHRHSKSRLATIRLARANKTIHLEVIDRGVGMALPSAATGWNSPLGIGIAGMRERVKQLGGVFEIQSEPGHGTTIRVELPVEESSQAVAEKKAELPRLKNSLPSAKTARAARAGS